MIQNFTLRDIVDGMVYQRDSRIYLQTIAWLGVAAFMVVLNVAIFRLIYALLVFP